MSEREKLPIERNWAFQNPEVRAKSLAKRKENAEIKRQAIADGTWKPEPKKPDKRKRKWTVVEKANTSKKRNQEIRKAKGIEQVLVDAEKLEREMLQEAQKIIGPLIKGTEVGTPLGPLDFGPPSLQDGYHNLPQMNNEGIIAVATDTQPPVTPSENPHLPALREMLEVVQGFDPEKDVFMTGADFQLILKALLYALGDA
jgi:hypothetical protein